LSPHSLRLNTLDFIQGSAFPETDQSDHRQRPQLLSAITVKMPLLSSLQQTFFLPKPVLTEHNIGDLSGRTVLVTGGNSGVGKELCAILYGANATVFLAGRNEKACAEALEWIKKEAPNSRGSITWLKLDLSDLSTIPVAVKEFLSKADRLDYLANNAGVMSPPAGTKGKQGHEIQHVTNCIGAYVLTESLRPLLAKTAKEEKAKGRDNTVRVSWAGSIGIELNMVKGGVEFVQKDGVEEPKIIGDPMKDYMVTKTGDLFLCKAWGDEVKQDGIVSVCFNPGNLWTGLQRHERAGGRLKDFVWQHILSKFLFDARYGAYTELWCGFSPDVTVEDQGRYIAPWGRKWTVRDDLEKARDGDIGARYVEWVRREGKDYIVRDDATASATTTAAPVAVTTPSAPTDGNTTMFG